MKKFAIMVTTAVLALTMLAGSTAFASGCRSKCNSTPKSTCTCAFVDANCDGICDKGDKHCNFVDANCDGICDNGDKHCDKYADANNDGVCDNCRGTCTHNAHTSHDTCTTSKDSHHSKGHSSHHN